MSYIRLDVYNLTRFTPILQNFTYNYVKITGNLEDFIFISNPIINDIISYNIINLSSKMNKIDAKFVGLNI